MTVLLLDGKKIASDTKLMLMDIVEIQQDNGIVPKLCVIQVGDDPASSVYVKQKNKMAESLGFNFNHINQQNRSHL